MGLFDKSKQPADDISQIKQMSSVSSTTTQQTSATQANMQNQTPGLSTNPTQAGQNDFVNPFANQNQQQVGQNPAPQMGAQTPNNMSSNLNSNQLPSFDSSMQQQNQPQSNFGDMGSQQFQHQTQPSGFAQSSISSSNPDEIQSLINETVEKLIEEKWVELTENVQKVVTWKSKVEDQITLIKEDVTAMQEGFTNLERRLISKINNYDKSILDVGSEIKALDKVFQKITPTLVNNVTELGRIAKDLKGVSHEKSSSSKE